jgi:hypothetical protein
MPSSLVSDWKRIAQSGPTMDGRVIKPEWLTDMAESYNPDVYTAMIWLDHMRYASYGSVKALKVEKDGDVVRLYAKISPSRSLLLMNQVWEQYLYFSIEPIENFAKSGKCYLGGLGMTDQPASLGTDEMRFSKMPGREYTARYAGEKVPDLREPDDEQDIERFGQKLARFFSKNNKPKEDNELMDKQQFEVLTTSLTNLQQTFGAFAEKLEKFTTAKPVEGEGKPQKDQADEAYKTQFTELKNSLTALDGKFNAIVERIEKVAPATEFKENTAAAADEAELL